MADAVQNIKITASLSPDYQRAFQMASRVSSQTTAALKSLQKEEDQIRAAVKATEELRAAASSNDAKRYAKAQKQYEKIRKSMQVQGKSMQDLRGQLAAVTKAQERYRAQQQQAASQQSVARQRMITQGVNETTRALERGTQQVSKFRSVLSQVGKVGISAFRGIGRGVKNSMASMGRGLAGGFGAAGMLGIGSLLGDVVQKSGDYKANAPLTGMTESQYSGLVETLKYYGGITQQDIETMFIRANEIGAGAAEGNKTSIEILRKMGLERDALSGLTQQQQFETMLNALVKTSGNDTVALSRDIFGKRGVSLVKQLQDTGKTGTQLFEDAKANEFDEKRLEEIHKAADSIQQVKDTIQRALVDVVTALPLNAVRDVIKGLADFAVSVVPILAKTFNWVWNNLLKPLMDMVNRIVAWLKDEEYEEEKHEPVENSVSARIAGNVQGMLAPTGGTTVIYNNYGTMSETTQLRSFDTQTKEKLTQAVRTKTTEKAQRKGGLE